LFDSNSSFTSNTQDIVGDNILIEAYGLCFIPQLFIDQRDKLRILPKVLFSSKRGFFNFSMVLCIIFKVGRI
jgi:hypothetical protein